MKIAWQQGLQLLLVVATLVFSSVTSSPQSGLGQTSLGQSSLGQSGLGQSGLGESDPEQDSSALLRSVSGPNYGTNAYGYVN